jgi:hypothetical protein
MNQTRQVHSLMFGVSLGLGIWGLVLIWDLVLGVWNFSISHWATPKFAGTMETGVKKNPEDGYEGKKEGRHCHGILAPG